MRRKYLSETFLKNVKRHDFKFFNEEEYFLCLKKIKEIEVPFYLKNGTCLINNNYYIVEILPKNKNYTIRIFFNSKKEEILYYYDIVDKIGIDKKLMIPYYDDLYLDVIYENNNIHILDEDEFENAFKNKQINDNQYKIAKSTINNLLFEIKQNENIMNIDFKELLKNE